jgi:hypothetical protein
MTSDAGWQLRSTGVSCVRLVVGAAPSSGGCRVGFVGLGGGPVSPTGRGVAGAAAGVGWADLKGSFGFVVV